jgi:hypothetical protein
MRTHMARHRADRRARAIRIALEIAQIALVAAAALVFARTGRMPPTFALLTVAAILILVRTYTPDDA